MRLDSIHSDSIHSVRLDLRGKFYCVGKFSVVCINSADVKTIIKCDEGGPPFCKRNNFTSSGHRHNDIANFAVHNFLHISGSVFPFRFGVCVYTYVCHKTRSEEWHVRASADSTRPWRTWEGSPSAFSTGDLIEIPVVRHFVFYPTGRAGCLLHGPDDRVNSHGPVILCCLRPVSV